MDIKVNWGGALALAAMLVAMDAGAFFREIDYDFSEGAEKRDNLWMVLGPETRDRWNISCLGTFQPYCNVRPGKYVIPMFGPWTARPAAAKGKAKFTVNCRQENPDIREFGAVGSRQTDGVYIAAKRADGTKPAWGDTLKTGDTIAIRMIVESEPDDLALTFYTVNRSSNWAFTGRWELLEIPGAPNSLRKVRDNPLTYGAVIRLPRLPKGCELTVNSLVADINYTGGDSRQYGHCYGFAPYAFSFEGGATSMQSGEYRFYDFGKADGPVQAGAMRVTPQDTPEGFKWVRGPRSYYTAFHRSLDASMADWAEARKDAPLEFRVTLPPNRTYRVAAGICSLGAKCYHNDMFMPYQGTLTANGRTLWRRTPAEAEPDKFRFMDREAEQDEDIYETYVKPYALDVGADVEVGADGLLTVSLAPFADGGANATPLNYLVVYPKDDAVCARAYETQLKNRRIRFGEFWRDISSEDWDLGDPLQAAAEEMGKGPLRLFPRENPGYWVLPRMRPLRTEVGEPLRISAAPGQKLTGTLMLNPTRDAEVTLSVSGLPAEANPRLWRQMHYRFAHGYSHFQKLGANHYLPMKPRRCKANTSYGYALRLDLPETIRPGLYRGTITARDTKGATATLPVELRIRDVKLPDLNDHRIAMLGGCVNSEHALRVSKDELLCTTATCMIGPTHYGKFTLDENGECVAYSQAGGGKGLDAYFKLYNRIGFPCREPFISIGGQGYVDPETCGPYKPFTPEYRACVKKLYGDIYAAAKANGLDNVVIDTGGEMGHDAKQPKPKTVEDAIRYFRTVQELVPGLKVSYRCNCWTTVKNFFPVLQVAGVRGAASWKTCDEMPAEGAKLDYYTYSCSGRFLNGIHSWAHGAKGNLREWMCWDHCCNYDDFLCQGDCGGNWHIEMMPGPGKTFVTSLQTEAFRASVDDRKYLRLLDRAIAAAKEGSEKANALAFEAMLRKVIADKMQDRSQAFGYWTSHRNDGNNPWPGLNLELVREVCVRFAKALGADGASGLPAFRPPEKDAFRFGLEDGPLVRGGTKAVTAVMNAKAANGERPVPAVATVKDASGRVRARIEFGDNARCRRAVFPAADLPPGACTLSLDLGGRHDSDYEFYVIDVR